MGFTGHSAKPSHGWVLHTVHSQSNICVYHTIHSQAISLLGLSGYLAKPTFTVGFIRLPSQRLLTRSNSTRHSQAIFLAGFIGLLRQWAGRTAKLVSSSTELRTPSQDLSGLASPLPTHPTQGSVPFSAQQSLRLHLPFCCKGKCPMARF